MSNNGGDNFLARPEPKANIQRSILILSASFQHSQATSNRNLLPTKTSNTSGIQCHSISMEGILSQMRSDLICLTSKRFAFFFISWRRSDLWVEIYWTVQNVHLVFCTGVSKSNHCYQNQPTALCWCTNVAQLQKKELSVAKWVLPESTISFGRWGPTLRSYCLLSANLYSTGGLDCK